MKIDLRLLKRVHQLLPATLAAAYSARAATALQRYQHVPGCTLLINVGDGPADELAVLDWELVPARDALQLDDIRTTEDGAEAIALMVANASYDWIVLRRLQRGESADWLLAAPSGELVAFEVSGIAGDVYRRRLDKKLEQVRKTKVMPARHSACVVAFRPPEAALATI